MLVFEDDNYCSGEDGSPSCILKTFEIPSVNFKFAKIARAVKNMDYTCIVS